MVQRAGTGVVGQHVQQRRERDGRHEVVRVRHHGRQQRRSRRRCAERAERSGRRGDAAVSMQAVHSSGSRQRDFLRHQWRQHGSTALAAAAAIGWGLYLWERRWGRRQQAASSGDAATAAVNTPKQ